MEGVKVIQGTCGWQDQQYPASVSKDATGKLQYFSRQLPSVEVNSSTYTILNPTTTASWAKAVPQNFIFHFKAFGLFCSKGSQYGNLPNIVKDMLPPGRYSSSSYVPMSELPPAAMNTAWSLFIASLEPIYQLGKLGVITFQFHLSFAPTESNMNYILECRRRLDSRFQMATEFRCRRWFTEESWRRKTHAALSSLGIAWVAADELEHETFQKDKAQTGLSPGQKRIVLPVAVEVTTPDFFYVRVHRRSGKEERRLTKEEIAAWKARIEYVIERKLAGPIYFLWGTDHADVPLRNSRALKEAIPENLWFDWKPEAPAGTIAALFNKNSKKPMEVKATEVEKIIESRIEIEEPSKAAKAPVAAKEKGIKRFFSQL
jgi:uncharacterized protein YecE (DUF72 family)